MHMHTHAGDRPFKCEVCGKGLSKKESMRRHSIIHFQQLKAFEPKHNEKMIFLFFDQNTAKLKRTVSF